MSDPHWMLGGLGVLVVASLLTSLVALLCPPCPFCLRRRCHPGCLGGGR